MTNREIEQVAAIVFAKHVQRGNSHRQLASVMSAEGIKHKNVNATSVGFVGALTRGNSGQYYIMVNQSIGNVGRRNFTIAHELGHYYLEHILQNASFYCSEDDIAEESHAADGVEREANHFASCLLIPEDKIRSAFLSMLRNSKKARNKSFLHVKNDYTFGIWRGICADLMKRYGVSDAALRYRLMYLSLAKFEFLG